MKCLSVIALAALCLTACNEAADRRAALERLEPQELVDAALDAPLDPNLESPIPSDPLLLEVLAANPERYVNALRNHLRTEYILNTPDPTGRATRAIALAARHFGVTGRLLIREQYRFYRDALRPLEARELAIFGEARRVPTRPMSEEATREARSLRAHITVLVTQEKTILHELLFAPDGPDSSLADDVVGRLRCYSIDQLESEIRYLHGVGRLTDATRAAIQKVAKHERCPLGPGVQRLVAP